jgi:hypothetical protein
MRRLRSSTGRILPLFKMVTAAAAVTLLTSCGYTLQTARSLPFDSISLGSIENRTFEPKLQDRLNRILTETLMEYGFEVTAGSRHVLSGTVTSFTLVPLAEKDLTTTLYQIIVTATFTLQDTETGESRSLASVKSPFMTTFSGGGTIGSVLARKELATESGLRDLSRELARRIVYTPQTPHP